MMRSALIAASAIFLSGCAGMMSSAVPESDKDPAFLFDGKYEATVDHPGGRQDMGAGWYSDCNPRQFTVPVSVVSSEVFWAWKDGIAKGFINSKGKFRLEHERDDGAKGIGVVMSDGTVTQIAQGNLGSDTMKGVYVEGVAQFANQGCSYPITFTKK